MHVVVMACLAEHDPVGDGIPNVCMKCNARVIISPITMENLGGRTYECICEKCVLKYDVIKDAQEIELPTPDQMRRLAKRIIRRN